MSAPQKTIEVEPSAEGPKVRAKRQMTDAQLAALKKGREKLAEKRKSQEQDKQESEQKEHNAETTKKTEDTQSYNEDEDEAVYAPLCAIM